MTLSRGTTFQTEGLLCLHLVSNGTCVLGGLLYVVFQELFSTSSPNKVYGKAFDKLKSNPEVSQSVFVLH